MRNINLTNFNGLLLRFQAASHGQAMERKKKILVVKLIASENRKGESSNSSVWEELKFEKFITSGMNNGDRKIAWQITIRRL